MEFPRKELTMLRNSPRPLWFVGADLSGADLGSADLHGAGLFQANLSSADPRQAN